MEERSEKSSELLSCTSQWVKIRLSASHTNSLTPVISFKKLQSYL